MCVLGINCCVIRNGGAYRISDIKPRIQHIIRVYIYVSDEFHLVANTSTTLTTSQINEWKMIRKMYFDMRKTLSKCVDVVVTASILLSKSSGCM